MKRRINSVIFRIQSNIAQKITLKIIPKFRYKMIGFEGSIWILNDPFKLGNLVFALI